MKYSIIIITILIALGSYSCKKENCQICTKTIGGFAGDITDEVREVCDEDEATKLEESSSGTIVWQCKQ